LKQWEVNNGAARVSFKWTLWAGVPSRNGGNDASGIDYFLFYSSGFVLHGAAYFPVCGDQGEGIRTSL
jgi:hypothetical protein